MGFADKVAFARAVEDCFVEVHGEQLFSGHVLRSTTWFGWGGVGWGGVDLWWGRLCRVGLGMTVHFV